jgi:brefeldin A-inhibited guanine nucleotide-exchange protein
MTADGDMLRGGWELALASISQLAVLKSIADGDEIQLATDSEASKRAKHAAGGFSLFSSGPSQVEIDRQLKSHIRETAGWVLSQVDWRTVEHCFIGSVHLNSEAIQDFVVALVRVSRGELMDKSISNKGTLKHASMPGMQNTPRTFSLQKIIEVTDFNMGTRPRMVWSKIWRELGEYFVFAGTHDDDAVAMYAVDSLKQLAMKFLEKKELKSFNFQRTFLRPFETIMKRSKSPLIRELVIMIVDKVRCLFFCFGFHFYVCFVRSSLLFFSLSDRDDDPQMVVARSANIRSGWQVIFDVLAATVADPQVSVLLFTVTLYADHAHNLTRSP